MNLIEQYVKTLLLEMADVPWDEAETAAKERYESAKAALNAWDEAKQAFDAEHDLWMAEIKAWATGDRKTRGLKPKEPTIGPYPTLRSKRSSFIKALNRAKDEHALYDPEFGLSRERPSTDEVDAINVPSDDVKIYGDINQLKPMRWYTWPMNIIKSSKLHYRPKGIGVGPGEEWFAHVFGGSVQGTGVSFDVVLPSGTRWELKALETSSSSFLTGTKGLQSTAYARTQLARMMKQLNIFKNLIEEFEIDAALVDNASLSEMIDHVVAFVEDEYDNIVTKGELPTFRMRGLRKVCIVVNKLLALREKTLSAQGDNMPNQLVGLDDEEYTVSRETFISIAHKVQQDIQKNEPDKQVTILSRYEELDVALSVFTHDVFFNPKGYWIEYFKMIQAKDVFQGVEGVIIINPSGIMKISSRLLGDAFQLKALTMGGKPSYGLRKELFGAGPEGAPPIPLYTKKKPTAAKSPAR